MATPKQRKPRRDKLTAAEKRQAVEWSGQGFSLAAIGRKLKYGSPQAFDNARKADNGFNDAIHKAAEDHKAAVADAEDVFQAAIRVKRQQAVDEALDTVIEGLQAARAGKDYDYQALAIAVRMIPRPEGVMRDDAPVRVAVEVEPMKVTFALPDLSWVDDDAHNGQSEVRAPVED